jgi:hypothetical protein
VSQEGHLEVAEVHTLVDERHHGILDGIGGNTAIVEHKDIDTLALEIAEVIQFQVRSFALAGRHE